MRYEKWKFKGGAVMITITLHNEETGAYIDGTFEFTFDNYRADMFLRGDNVTLNKFCPLAGVVTVNEASIGNKKSWEVMNNEFKEHGYSK